MLAFGMNLSMMPRINIGIARHIWRLMRRFEAGQVQSDLTWSLLRNLQSYKESSAACTLRRRGIARKLAMPFTTSKAQFQLKTKFQGQ